MTIKLKKDIPDFHSGYESELSRLRQRVAELEADAERYQIVRMQHWESSPFAVVMDPKNAVKLGYDCPSEERLDEIVDGLRETGEPL